MPRNQMLSGARYQSKEMHSCRAAGSDPVCYGKKGRQVECGTGGAARKSALSPVVVLGKVSQVAQGRGH